MLRLVLRCGELIEREKRVWTIGMLSFKAKSSTQKWKRPFYPKMPQKKKKMWKLAGRNHSLTERRSTERKKEKKKRKSENRQPSHYTVSNTLSNTPPPPCHFQKDHFLAHYPFHQIVLPWIQEILKWSSQSLLNHEAGL